MGITVGWDHSGQLPDHTVIYWSFEGVWDWNDFSEADKCAYELALSQTHTVHSIVDFRGSSHIPSNGVISYFARSVTKAPPNRGLVVVVGAPRIIQALEGILRLLTQKAASKYRLVDNLESAFVILKQFQE